MAKGINIKQYGIDFVIDVKKNIVPDEVHIPLIQHLGKPAHSIVKESDYVKVGQKIGESDKFISSFIHSSVSGHVKGMYNISHPKLRSVPGIVIVNDKENKLDKSILKEPRDISDISKEEIIDLIRKAGVVGMGGAAFPTHVKLSPPNGKKIDSYILNGAECEPYLKSDTALIKHNAKFVILGMKLAMKAVGVSKGYIGVEKSNIVAIDNIKKAISALQKDNISIELKLLPNSYPQGSEKQIIKTILNRKVPPGGLPYEIGVIVNNVSTCFAIYEAVAMRKPLYERIITIAGDGVKHTGNFMVPIGTKFKDILSFCESKSPIGKVISGGPIMGDAQLGLDTPVIKGTGGIIFLSRDTIKRFDNIETECIKCGRCVDACPLNLIPQKLVQLVKHEKWDELNIFNINDCVECGCCTYICPANIPIMHLIKLGKSYIS